MPPLADPAAQELQEGVNYSAKMEGSAEARLASVPPVVVGVDSEAAQKPDADAQLGKKPPCILTREALEQDLPATSAATKAGMKEHAVSAASDASKKAVHTRNPQPETPKSEPDNSKPGARNPRGEEKLAVAAASLISHSALIQWV